MSKVLVAYFSVGGTTAKAAKDLAAVEGVCVDDGKRLGGELSEEDLKLWAEGLA